MAWSCSRLWAINEASRGLEGYNKCGRFAGQGHEITEADSGRLLICGHLASVDAKLSSSRRSLKSTDGTANVQVGVWRTYSKHVYATLISKIVR